MPVVESIERKYSIVPVNENNGDNGRQKKEEKKSKSQRNTKTSNIVEATPSTVSDYNGFIKENVSLLFSLDKSTGETEAYVVDKSNNTIRSIDFDDVTKASEKIYERRGVIFDKRL
ncbi:MAG: flagellar protein FlaG [Bacteroidota bacterium]